MVLKIFGPIRYNIHKINYEYGLKYRDVMSNTLETLEEQILKYFESFENNRKKYLLDIEEDFNRNIIKSIPIIIDDISAQMEL